ncbi:Phosphatidylserine decarboxylase [Lachnospiraceae bacterium TWA4]|nr:Phosphatidylserine decarboxylase [Lachnospiraceae bacterium TWA4]
MQTKILKFLYETRIGRLLLSILIKPRVSEIGGWLLNQKISKIAIKPFIKANHIDMSQYEDVNYQSYNDFFMRRIKLGARPIDRKESHLIAPCDSKLTVYPIHEDSSFCIKDTYYTMEELFHSKKLAKAYEGGQLLLFRLTVDDYHRYCYVDEGVKSKNYRIQGFFHTVNPLANDVYPIYKENTREFSLLKSKNFGIVLMMEVGALLVGKIVNYHQEKNVVRGEEKGRFEFGGSTVILCVKKNQVVVDEQILENSRDGIETM